MSKKTRTLIMTVDFIDSIIKRDEGGRNRKELLGLREFLLLLPALRKIPACRPGRRSGLLITQMFSARLNLCNHKILIFVKPYLL